MKLIEYTCTEQECKKTFYIPKHPNPFALIKQPNNAEYCPFCGSGDLFNVTFEEELGTFNLK